MVSPFLITSAKEGAMSAIRSTLFSPAQMDSGDEDNEWLPQTPYRDNNSEIVETFNNSMTTLSKLVPSAGHFTPIVSRLQSKLHEASNDERKKCIETARNASQIVCNVVAPKDKHKLFNILRPSNPEANIPQNVEGLLCAYAKAPTSHLKPQILSLYVNWFPARTLMKLHKNFETITEWQIRKEDAKIVGPSIPTEKVKTHHVHLESTSWSIFFTSSTVCICIRMWHLAHKN